VILPVWGVIADASKHDTIQNTKRRYR